MTQKQENRSAQERLHSQVTPKTCDGLTPRATELCAGTAQTQMARPTHLPKEPELIVPRFPISVSRQVIFDDNKKTYA